jgi:hypothetical protein
VLDALDGRCLLREQLTEEVVRRVGPRPRERLRSGFAFFLGDLCQGPPEGTKITLVRPDQWIDGWRPVTEADALASVLRRYLYVYGPSRPSDFREWSSPISRSAASATSNRSAGNNSRAFSTASGSKSIPTGSAPNVDR